MDREPEVTERESKFLKTIGDRIRDERKKRSLTISELARMVNLSDSFLGLIERGEKGTRLYNLINICDALGIKINDLIYTSGATKLMFAERTKEMVIVKREKINSLIYDLGEKQLDMVINLISGLKDLESEPQNSKNRSFS